MRKVIIVLLLAMTVNLWGCARREPSPGTQPPVSEPTLQTGFGRQEITPETALPLAGGEEKRVGLGILDALYVTCVAVTDSQGQSALLLSADVQAVPPELTVTLRSAVGEETGVNPTGVIVCPTGTCSAPDLSDPQTEAYREVFVLASVRAAADAMADRADSQIAVAVWDAPELATAGYRDSEVFETDTALRLICFERSQADDIVLLNYQARADLASDPESDSYQMISADFVGYAREYVEREGVSFAYFRGADGNMTAGSPDGEEREDCEQYGVQLGKAVVSAMKERSAADDGALEIRQQSISLQPDNTDDDRAQVAREIVQEWENGHNESVCADMAAPYDIHSIAHARAIIRRAERTQPIDMTLTTVRLGQIAFASLPCELFDSDGVAVRREASCEMTFVLCGKDDRYGCLPEDAAFDYGCPQVDTRLTPRGTAETVVKQTVRMINGEPL